MDPLDLSLLAARLAAAGCVAADEEAAELTADSPPREELAARLSRREQGEPLAWIVGSAPFLGRRLLVEPGVYVPRRQSEELAARAAGLLPAAGRAADLCTGAGPVARHLIDVQPAAFVVGTDLDGRAARCARRNGVPVLVADLAAGLRTGCFDVVTAVPPYVPKRELAFLPADVVAYEPPRALAGGEDGLEVARRVVAAAARLLRRGGHLLLELGGEQDAALAPVLAAAGFGDFVSWRDGDGDLRGLAARLERDQSLEPSRP